MQLECRCRTFSTAKQCLTEFDDGSSPEVEVKKGRANEMSCYRRFAARIC